MILVVAATPEELRGAGGAATLVCGVGPVEAAARTATALAETAPDAVLHVGLAGGRAFGAIRLTRRAAATKITPRRRSSS